MQVRFEESNIPLSTARPGQSHAGGPGKFDFCCSKVYLCIFYVKFSVAWRIFVYNLSSWNDYDSLFFSFSKNKDLICESRITSRWFEPRALSVWVNYIVKYIYICIMFLMHDNLNKLQNHIGKLFFCPPPKIDENTTNILNCYFWVKLTPWLIS